MIRNVLMAHFHPASLFSVIIVVDAAVVRVLVALVLVLVLSVSPVGGCG
jgi:uncharacterized membrane protein YhfC